MLTCPFCASWDQEDPNCGHAMLNGVLLPARFTTRAFVDNSEMGRRTAGYLAAENSGSGFLREEHIQRQVNYALSGGWKSAS